MELAAAVMLSDFSGDFGVKPDQITILRRCLREPSRDGASASNRSFLIFVDHPVDKECDVRPRTLGLFGTNVDAV
jgi:hypothetical protein